MLNEKPDTGQIRFHLYEAPRAATFIKTESRMVVARGGERKEWEVII